MIVVATAKNLVVQAARPAGFMHLWPLATVVTQFPFLFWGGDHKVNYPVDTIPSLDRSVKQLNLVRFAYSVAFF